MKKNKLILSTIVLVIAMLSIVGFMYLKSDDRYDTQKLIAEKQTLNKSQTKELARKTLLVCATDFDEKNTGAINVEKINNIYTLTYNKSKEAQAAYERYSKDDNIVYCEFDTALETSEVSSNSILDAIIGIHINESDNKVFETLEMNANTEMNTEKATVVVIDSGANGEYKQSYNAFDGTSNVSDEVGHGTEMIKKIKEQTGNINYEIIPIKVANDNGYATVSTLIKALNYASELKPTVVNMSLTSMKSSKAEIINQYIARMGYNGTAVIVSAGNNSDNVTKYSPASSKDAIVVGSCDKSGKIKDFSNYGETIDYLITSNSTSEAAAITSGLYVKAYLTGKDPFKTMYDSGIAFKYDGGKLDKNIEGNAVIDDRLWWCAKWKNSYLSTAQKCFQEMGLDEVGAEIQIHDNPITIYEAVYNGYKIGSEKWNPTKTDNKKIKVRVIIHASDGHAYFNLRNLETDELYRFVCLKNVGPNNGNGKNPHLYSNGWFEYNNVKKAVEYTNTVCTVPDGYSNIKLGKTTFTAYPGLTYNFNDYKYKPATQPKGYSYYNKIKYNEKYYSLSNTFTQPKNDAEFYYVVKPNTYTISYNLNGGTISGTNPASYTITKSLKSDEFKSPTKTGYTFAGWTRKRVPGAKTFSKGESYYTIAQVSKQQKYTITINDLKLVSGDSNYSQVVMINKSDNNSIVTDENGKNVYANVYYGKDSQTVTLTCPNMDEYYGKNMAIVLYNGMRVADKSNIKTSYSSIVVENTTNNPRLNYKTFFNNISNNSSINDFKNACNRSEVGNISMTANWTAYTYSVQFNSNNGKNETKKQTEFKYGTSRKLDLNTFENEGYSFKGWAVSKDDANRGIVKYLDGESVKNLTTVNKDIIQLYAVWEKKVYTVKFNANGGQGTMPDMTCYYGVFYTPKCTFSNGSKSFTGWSTAPNSDTDFITFEVSDIMGANDTEATLYAQWANNTNTVIYHANNGTNETKSSNFLAGSDLTLDRNTFTRQGYKFKGWSKNKAGETAEYKDQETIKNVFTNLELYAVWEKVIDTYTLKFDANGGIGSLPAHQCRYGETILLPSRTAETFYKPGYCFQGWSRSSEGTEAEYRDGGSYKDETREEEREENKEVTLYAVWVKIPVTAQDIYLEYEEIYLINDEIFMNQEAEITVSENKYGITLAESEITNLTDAYNNAQKHADDGSQYDLKATVVYSTGDKTEITFKLHVAKYDKKTETPGSSSSIRYIRKDTINSLRSTSEWLKADKNALLREVLNKDLSKLKSYKVTKAKL